MPETQNKIMWQAPWGYRESFSISVGLLFIGWLLEWFSNAPLVEIASYPTNRYMAVIWLTVGAVLFFTARKNFLVKWLSSVPAAIASVGLLALLSLFLGFFAQTPNDTSILGRLGISHMTDSWPFLIAILWVIICLEMAVLKRIRRFKWKDTWYILSHLGLLIAIIGGVFGAPEVERLVMNAFEGRTIWMAQQPDGKMKEVPVAVKLINFDIEEYPPKLAIVDNTTGKVLESMGKPQYQLMDEDTLQIWKYQIIVKKYYSMAAKVEKAYYPVETIGAAPAALITTTRNGQTTEGWTYSGSLNFQPEALKINSEHSLIMLPPEPKHYFSDAVVITPDQKRDSVRIRVNEAVKVNGWKIYQLDYDTDMGRWSNKSVLELVHDPWLPIVYIGIFMMIGGAIMLFWQGKNNSSK
ncbi:hypothetical protein EMN47_06315 [Prolixibacteraceae bacterium JC049]|nr:hypothetical protein [Prolixibacteraceae bacterium JC049]